MEARFIDTEIGIELVINNQTVFTYKNVFVDGKHDGISHEHYDDTLSPKQLNALMLLEIRQLPEFFNYHGVYEFKHRHFDIVIDVPDNVLHISLEIDLPNWEYPFSFSEFSSYLQIIAKQNDIDININTDIYSTLSLLNSKPQHDDLNIKDQLDWAVNSIIKYHDVAINTLLERSNEHLLTKIFNFPPEYKNICSQYLLWFGEFLKNLGIDANVSTEQKNGGTTLIVSPEENGELLTKIEELFYRYIDLPYMEYIPYNADNMNTSQKYKMDSLLDEIGDYQHKLKKAMRHQRLLEAENDGLLEDKIKLKINVKELEKDKLLLKSSLKDPKKNEFFSCFNKSFSLVGSVDNKNDLTLGFGVEIKPKGMVKEMFKSKDKSESADN